jgi:ABC-type nitrate/sulfonate/bicarbonate transport system substrate-binding protein
MAIARHSTAIRAANISEGVNAWPIYIAQARDDFGREGIAVEFTLTGSSARQIEALTRGGFDIGFQQSDHIVRAVEHGYDLFVFMPHGHAPELSLVVAPGITNFESLRGKVIAVDGARTGYALILRKLLGEQGLRDGEYEFKEFGGSRERFDALLGGKAAASWLNPPFDRNLFAAGFGSLGTTTDFFPTYPGSVAAARRSWAAANAAKLVAFIRAIVAAINWLRVPANKAEAIRVLPARLGIDSRTAECAFDEFCRRPPPQVTAEGLRQVIDVVWEAERMPLPKGTPDKYLDLAYLEQALDSGAGGTRREAREERGDSRTSGADSG